MFLIRLKHFLQGGFAFSLILLLLSTSSNAKSIRVNLNLLDCANCNHMLQRVIQYTQENKIEFSIILTEDNMADSLDIVNLYNLQAVNKIIFNTQLFRANTIEGSTLQIHNDLQSLVYSTPLKTADLNAVKIIFLDSTADSYITIPHSTSEYTYRLTEYGTVIFGKPTLHQYRIVDLKNSMTLKSFNFSDSLLAGIYKAYYGEKYKAKLETIKRYMKIVPSLKPKIINVFQTGENNFITISSCYIFDVNYKNLKDTSARLLYCISEFKPEEPCKHRFINSESLPKNMSFGGELVVNNTGLYGPTIKNSDWENNDVYLYNLVIDQHQYNLKPLTMGFIPKSYATYYLGNNYMSLIFTANLMTMQAADMIYDFDLQKNVMIPDNMLIDHNLKRTSSSLIGKERSGISYRIFDINKVNNTYNVLLQLDTSIFICSFQDGQKGSLVKLDIAMNTIQMIPQFFKSDTAKVIFKVEKEPFFRIRSL